MRVSGLIDRITRLVSSSLGEAQTHVLFLLGHTSEGTETAYSSGLDRAEAMRFLIDMIVRMRSQIEPRVMGQCLDATSDAVKIAAFELIGAAQRFLGDRMTPENWRDLLLVFCVGMAHDQGITRADFERCALELADEEWSTPNTEGRAALGDLLGKTKPQEG